MRATPPKLRDVALRAAVHTATASRALNPATRRLVNADTAERVLRAARELGYRPNPIARGLKTNRSASVGVVIPDLTNPLFPPIVRGIEDALAPEGYHALLVNTDHDLVRESHLVETLRDRQVEGFIFATARLSHPVISALAAEGVPAVLVNRRLDGLDLPTVAPDDAPGIGLVLAYLAGLGHERVAHIAGPPSTSTGLTRRDGFEQGVRRLGLSEDPALIVTAGAFTEEHGYRCMAELAASGAAHTAVVCANDLLALGCYSWMNENGVSCPGQISITGFNNMPFIDKIRPPLTTVSVPHYQIGLEAARLLLERIRVPAAAPKSIVLPPTLVVRGSCAAPAGKRRPRRPAAVG